MMRIQIVSVCLSAVCSTAVCAEVEIRQTSAAPSTSPAGRLSVTARALDEQQEYAVGLQIPLLGANSNYAAVDLRGAVLDEEESEWNGGLILRRFVSDSSLVGINAYYDSRSTASDNRFDQAGFGMEVLSRWVDVRANYYHPLTDAVKTSEEETVDRVRTSSRIVETVSQFRSYEEALDGYDAEIGVWIPGLSRVVPTAIFAGYYQFNSDLVDDSIYGGAKARIEMHVSPLLGLFGEWFEEDALNQSEYIASVRIQLPFDFWRRDAAFMGTGPYAPLRGRVSDEVQRDLRVRTIQTGPVLYNQIQKETAVNRRHTPRPAQPPSVTCRDVFVTDPLTGVVTVERVCD